MIKRLARCIREFKWPAILSPLCMIGEVAMEVTIPLVMADLYDFGITLTGGGALLPGLGYMIFERTGVRVRVAKRPMESVCNGLLRIIHSTDNPEEFLRHRER